MGTLTYAGEGVRDPAVLRGDVAGFFRRLRDTLGAGPLPYVWVPEWHPGGHGLHAHFAVDRFVRHSLLESMWGHGWVSIKRLADMPVGSTPRDMARRAAGYLAKYVSKTFAHTEFGRHRYEVAQGFQPRILRLTGVSVEDVLAQAVAIMGMAPATYWSSRDVEDWNGPPAVWFAWA